MISRHALRLAPRVGRSMLRHGEIRLLRTSAPLLEEVKINVPNLGDSITEGTIVEWTVDVGQQGEAITRFDLLCTLYFH